jgi:hypothetical protein
LHPNGVRKVRATEAAEVPAGILRAAQADREGLVPVAEEDGFMYPIAGDHRILDGSPGLFTIWGYFENDVNRTAGRKISSEA